VFLFLYSMEVNIGRETSVGIVCGYGWSCDVVDEVTPCPCGFKVIRFQGSHGSRGRLFIYSKLWICFYVFKGAPYNYSMS